MNNEKTYENNTKIINIISLISITVFMLFLNFNCGYCSDDWHFKFVFTGAYPDADSRYIGSFSDIILSARNFRETCGGRVLCHAIIFFINMFEKPVFNIINSLMFTALGYLSYMFIKCYTKTKFRFMLPAVYIIFILLLPRFGDNCLWLSGAVNYLWSSVILLCSFICINTFAKAPDLGKALLLCIPIFISSLTNEMTGGMIIVYLLLTFVYEYSFKAYYSFIFIPPVLAIIYVISAPGNQVRSGGITSSEVLHSITVHIFQILKLHYLFVIILLFAIIITLKYNKSLKPFIGGIKLAVTGIAGIMALSFSGQIDYRPYFIGCIPFFIGSIICAVNIYDLLKSEKNIDIRSLSRYISLCTLVCIVFYVINLLASKEKFEFLFAVPIIVMTVILFIGAVIPILAKSINKDKLNEFRKKLGNPRKYIPAAILITVIPYMALNLTIFLNNSHARKLWYKNVEELIVSQQYDAALNQQNPVDLTGIFDPDSSYYMDSSAYVILWFAYDKGVYIETTSYTSE